MTAEVSIAGVLDAPSDMPRFLRIVGAGFNVEPKPTGKDALAHFAGDEGAVERHFAEEGEHRQATRLLQIIVNVPDGRRLGDVRHHEPDGSLESVGVPFEGAGRYRVRVFEFGRYSDQDRVLAEWEGDLEG